jgi:hypothetical protein
LREHFYGVWLQAVCGDRWVDAMPCGHNEVHIKGVTSTGVKSF